MKLRHALIGLATAMLLGTMLVSTALADDDKDDQPITLKGTIEPVVAIGGESTGFMLTYKEGDKTKRIDVDLSGIKDKPALEPTQVEITGTVYIKHYVERGATRILKAEKIKQIKKG